MFCDFDRLREFYQRFIKRYGKDIVWVRNMFNPHIQDVGYRCLQLNFIFEGDKSFSEYFQDEDTLNQCTRVIKAMSEQNSAQAKAVG